MEIVVPPPEAIRYLLVGLPLLVLVVALFLKGKPLVHRIAPVVLVSTVCLIVFHFASRPMRFSWDERGIRDETFGGPRAIAWSDIREARLLRCFRTTGYQPVRRTNGTYYSGYASGTWQLANGTSVRVFLMPASVDALLVTTADATYLLAPSSFDRFAEAVRAKTGRLSGP